MSVIGWQDRMKPELYFTNCKQVVRGRGEEIDDEANENPTPAQDGELMATLFDAVDAVANHTNQLIGEG